MSPFDSVGRPSIKKKPSSTGANTTNNLVKLGSLGLLGFGVILLNALTGGSPPTGHTNKDIVSVLAGYELSANCANSGCIKVTAGATKDGTIFASGAGIRVVGAGNVGATPLCEISATGAIQGSACAITAGVSISGSLSQTNADARYVRKSGSTMSGALNIIVSGGTSTTVSLETPHTISGSRITLRDHQVASQKCGTVLLFGSGTSVTAGRSRAAFTLSYSGALVKVHAKHGIAGDGLTTYDVNINGITRLSTKITVDANERCSDTFITGGTCTDAAAAAPVITTPNFMAGQEITIDVDSQAGALAPVTSAITLCFEPDSDGFTNY